MAAPSIEDRLALNDLLVRYAMSLDACDVEGVIACFTEDCVLDTPISGVYHGHDGIRRFASDTARFKADRGGQFRHVISNMRIDADGDAARVRCYLLDFLTIDGKTELLSPGEYDCDAVRVDGEWKLRRRLVRMDVIFSADRWAS
jgi:3-phenylpropionate/cinnamic acid dioxygenase small subunit